MNAGASKAVPSTRVGAWSPLQQPVFRALWTAGVVSNIGTWMQNVGGAWLMTLLTSSPVMVALMQTATSLPVLLIGVPAGALADVVDRRRILLVTQSAMLVAAVGLSVLTFMGAITPWSLLAFTFVLGLAGALSVPAWQAITPEIVAPETLAAAVTLTGVSVNIARAVGPALGGVILAAGGPGWVFLLNALSFVGVIAVIYRWRRTPARSRLPAEHLLGALRAGWRYVRHAPPLHAVLVHAAVFISCASALWALMPVVAQRELRLDATGYGVLYGCIGVGALLGAVLLPQLRLRLSLNGLVAAAALVFALATLALGCVRDVWVNGLMMIVGGVAWISMMSSLNVAALTGAPRWVQARSIAYYMVAFQGAMAGSSVVWGAVAERLGNPAALVMAAVGLVAGVAVTARWPLSTGEGVDLAPSLHWPEPMVVTEPDPDDGPVLIMIEYRIDPHRAREFAQAVRRLRAIRRRDGALRGRLYSDPADPGRYLETYVVESWAEHLRQHERFTVSDRAVEDIVRAFHMGESPPVASHFIAAPVPRQTE